VKKLIPLLFLGIAFGMIEGSVVIYLRPFLNNDFSDYSLKILQPENLDQSKKTVIITEIYREAATLVLLASAAVLAATSFLSWFCYFVFIFGVWDIIYYVWIYLRIGWPESIMEWDVLFLIPRMWFAPVIVPCLISLTGIVISMIVLRVTDIYGQIKPRPRHWIPIAVALVLWQISFLNKSLDGMTTFPSDYSWWLFFAGMIMAVSGSAFFVFDFFIAGNIERT